MSRDPLDTATLEGPDATGGIPLVFVAARTRNNVIGLDGDLPWHVPGDLAFFRQTTMGYPVVMGRRTFDSIGGPLEGRPTIVVSQRADRIAPGVTLVRTIDSALAAAGDRARHMGVGVVMIAGGATVYSQLMPRAACMLITEIDMDTEGDTVFPPIDREVWSMVADSAAALLPGDPCGYRFTRWERRRTGGGIPLPAS